MTDLPAPGSRMTPGRKAQIVAAVRDGTISRADALKLYDLTGDELDGWTKRAALHGINGLRATRQWRGE